jgi:hypothetical protein
MAGKLGRYGEQKGIAIGEVLLPLAVGAEVGERRLDLDDGDAALPVQPQYVGAATVAELHLGDHGIVEVDEKARNSADHVPSDGRKSRRDIRFVGTPRMLDHSHPPIGRAAAHMFPKLRAIEPETAFP